MQVCLWSHWRRQNQRGNWLTTKAKPTNQNSYNQYSKECINSAMETWSIDTKPVINIVWVANVNSVGVSSFIILYLPDKWTCPYFLGFFCHFFFILKIIYLYFMGFFFSFLFSKMMICLYFMFFLKFSFIKDDEHVGITIFFFNFLFETMWITWGGSP